MLTQLDNDRIALMRAFVESARRLNFAAAARELNLTPSALGRRIQRLEAHLGVALFVRSTRRVALTDAGALYWRQSEDILSAIAAADAMASSLSDRPTGLLRISAPASFGRLYLSRVLPSFLRDNPELQVDLMYGDQNVDLIGARVDVAGEDPVGAPMDAAVRLLNPEKVGGRAPQAPGIGIHAKARAGEDRGVFRIETRNPLIADRDDLSADDRSDEQRSVRRLRNAIRIEEPGGQSDGVESLHLRCLCCWGGPERQGDGQRECRHR